MTISAIEAAKLLEGTTPGPWGCDLTDGSVYHDDGDVKPLVASVMTDCVSDGQAAADCYLIAAAPDLAAALIASEAARKLAEEQARDLKIALDAALRAHAIIKEIGDD